MWVVSVTIAAFVVALAGYDLIHRAEQVLTYLMLVIFGIFTGLPPVWLTSCPRN